MESAELNVMHVRDARTSTDTSGDIHPDKHSGGSKDDGGTC